MTSKPKQLSSSSSSRRTTPPMCPTFPASPSGLDPESDPLTETINDGSLRHVDLHTGSNGWSSPPAPLFHLRSKSFLTRRLKSPSSLPYLLRPAGVDWLRSATRLDNLLARPDTRFARLLKSHFVFAVNLQIPGRDFHSAAFYFASADPISPNSLLHRFINGDDSFRNSRFKIVNRIEKGPWIVKAAVGNYAACLLGKAVTCRYHRGENYLEVDVDIGSSKIASAVLRLALGYVTSVTIDMGFLVEGQTEDELPERLIGAVRIAQMEMGSARLID